MSKKILAICYSQSGQLGEILRQFASPLISAGNEVEFVEVRPLKPYPFPWKGNSFFTVMPDCVHGVPTELEEIELKEKSYDLIIFGYQAWFLSPSIPSNSILQHPKIKAILDKTPVVAVTGARNMWISAMERIKDLLKERGARLVGHIALVDKHSNLVSFITIFYWMMTAKKDKFLNIFPAPGVSKADIMHGSEFGSIVEVHLRKNSWEGMQNELIDKKAVVIRYRLMFIESKARRIFKIWAAFIVKRKNRSFWLQVYKYYLIIALFVAAPIILTVDAIFFKPFLSKRITNQKLKYSGVN